MSNDTDNTTKSTTRQAYVTVVNNWGGRVSSVLLTRRTDDTPTEFNFGELAAHEVAIPQPITYWTGIGSSKDFWSIQFVDSKGVKRGTDGGQRQGIQTEDEGQVLLVTIDGEKEKMRLFFSSGTDRKDIEIRK